MARHPVPPAQLARGHYRVMADETPRLGLPIYTSGSDLHPTREDFNDRMALLEEAVAIARQGTREDRPMPSTRGTLFMETDTGLLWFDTGDEWIRVVRVGNDGPGRAVDVGGDGAEGASEWAARADHTHPLPLATASSPGALSAADKALLNTASANPTSNALARRNGSGQMSAAAPSAATHVTPRSYVDSQVNTRAPSSHTHHADDVNAGTLAPARLPTATQSAQGALSADDKTKLDRASSTSTDAGQLMSRNSDGQSGVGTPTHGNHAANKHYVDTQISGHRHSADDVNRGTFEPARLPAATSSQQGALSAADKSKLDAATAGATGGALAQRNSSGQIAVSDPSHASHATTRRYVDDETSDVRLATAAAFGNRLVRRTADGVASIGDPTAAPHITNKRYVDDVTSDLREATPADRGSTLMRRNAAGQAAVTDPIAASHATTKRYVDQEIGTRARVTQDLGTQDLDNVWTPGDYYQNTNDRATSARNYPSSLAGALTVLDQGAGFRSQEYVARGGTRYRRTGSSNSWNDWIQVPGHPELITADNLFDSLESGYTLNNVVGVWTDLGNGLARMEASFAISGVTLNEGGQNTRLGTVAAAYRGTTSIPVTAYTDANRGIDVSLTSDGSLRVRWASGSFADWSLFFTFSHLVEA